MWFEVFIEMGKALSKTQKKIDNNVRSVLNSVCESVLKDVAGFQWVTHQADYANFPASLMIVCVFDSEKNITDVLESGVLTSMKKHIHMQLLKVGVVLKHTERQIVADSIERCEREHDGDWALRLKSAEGRAIPKNFPKKQ